MPNGGPAFAGKSGRRTANACEAKAMETAIATAAHFMSGASYQNRTTAQRKLCALAAIKNRNVATRGTRKAGLPLKEDSLSRSFVRSEIFAAKPRNSAQRRENEVRYGLCPLLPPSSLTTSESNSSIGSLPLMDSDWLVRVESDNARISSRISASGSGWLGGMLINIRDAADLKFCLLLRFFR